MGIVVNFEDYIKISRHYKGTNRIEALVKGRLSTYTCDSCGRDFEVDKDHRPDKCPNCNVHIDVWNDLEEGEEEYD